MGFLLLEDAEYETDRRRRLDGFRVLDESAGGIDSSPVSILPAPARINAFVGPNNAGKSRLLRQLFSQPFVLLGDDPATAKRLATLQRLAEFGEQMLAAGMLDCGDGAFDADVQVFVQQLRRLFVEPWTALNNLGNNQTGLLRSGTVIEFWVGPAVWNVIGMLPADLASVGGLATASRDFVLGALIALGVSRPAFNEGAHRNRKGSYFCGLLSVERTHAEIPRVYCPPLRSTLRIADAVGLHVTNAGADGPDSSVAVEPIGKAVCLSYGWAAGQYTWTVPTSAGIFTGGRLYELADAMYRQGPASRKRLEGALQFAFTSLLGLAGARLIASLHTNHAGGTATPIKHLRVEVGGEDLSLHDLGDGISACLTILLPILAAEEPSFIFVEEPETHLHPGLQRKLIHTLSHPDVRAKGHTYFISTHSPIILDAIADVAQGSDLALFRVEKAVGGHGGFTNVTRINSVTVGVLEALGATASALLARTLILVEGPSDVRYLRGLLELHYAHLGVPSAVEGRDFALLTYGGSLLGDLLIRDESDLAKAVLPSVNHFALIIADEDEAKSDIHKRRVRLLEPTEGRFRYVTTGDAVEIENCLSGFVWKKLFPLVHPIKWKEPLAMDIDEPTLATTRLGSLAAHLFEGSRIATPSVTLTSEEKMAAARAFERLVRAKDVSWNDLGQRAQTFAKVVADYVTDALTRQGITTTQTPRV